MGDERDSGDITKELKAIGRLSRRVKSIASIATAVITIGGIGAWVGVLQYTVNEMKSDVTANEKAIKALPLRFETIDVQERTRLEKLRDATVAQFGSDKDALWEIKNAVSQIRLEIRFRHGERATPVMVQAEPMPPNTPRRPTRGEVQQAARTSDKALVRMATDDEDPSDPLGALTF